MTKVLITGANGYIGSHVVNEFLKLKDTEISVVDFKNDNINQSVKYFNIDILNEAGSDSLYKQLNSPDVVVHLAWQDGFNHNAESHLANLNKHYQFLKNMIDSGCKNINVMGTMHEVGYYEGEIKDETPCRPQSLYGISKNALRQAISLYIRDKDISLKWLRAFYILGDDVKNKSVFTKILQFEKKGKETFPFTDGKNKYDFIKVDELARQIAMSSIQNNVVGIINCCSGNPVTLKEKVEEFIEENNLKIRPQYGVFPSRLYDSPAIWGNTDKIESIVRRTK
ncbi:MAG: NAD-dependent epimerase/dehydratase family protein [Alphaproteobacteria bacterium]